MFLLTRREQIVLSLVLFAFVAGIGIRHARLLALIPTLPPAHSSNR